MLTQSNVIIAILLTVVAGMSTGIGGLLSLLTRRTNTRVLSGALGLSAGVMVYISFMELLPEATDNMALTLNHGAASLWTAVAFFGGIGLIALIDFLVPEDENPHEIHSLQELSQPDNHHMKRTGVMLAVAIAIHNFPEGIATFVSGLDGLEVALPIVVAIAIHNIPEGIAVSVPIYQATGSRRRALAYTVLSGLSEPLGAIIGALVLMPLWSPMVNAICLAMVAGIMIYISFDELLPGSEAYGHHHIALSGVILGMALMAGTMLIL